MVTISLWSSLSRAVRGIVRQGHAFSLASRESMADIATMCNTQVGMGLFTLVSTGNTPWYGLVHHMYSLYVHLHGRRHLHSCQKKHYFMGANEGQTHDAPARAKI